MKLQSVQTRTFRLGGTIVSNRAQAVAVLDSAKQDQCILIEQCCAVIRFFSDLSGGACLPPDQPPVAVMGQEGSL